METLQIRLPKKIISKIDQLVKAGFYQNRSQILRQAVQKFILETSFNGCLPYIVGPYSNEIDPKMFDQPLGAYEVSQEERSKIHKIVMDLKSIDL
ncbi:MAG: ribbon-helix-helix domain-containing protein [Promethearchaeota archaeon]